jgi:Xaa-Pro aminopeptidase
MAKENLTRLRAELARQNLDGFIVPHGDEFQNEYLPACNERLAWLTGFTGSAGLAIVLKEKAALFIDGRYTVQAAAETAEDFERCHITNNPPEIWLKQNAGGLTLGYDPWLHTPREVEKFAAAGKLIPVTENPIDTVWQDRPAPPQGRVTLHPLDYAGESSVAKRARVSATMKENGIEAAIMTDPAAIAWLLNVRGCDVPCTPLPLSYAILYQDGSADWFVDPAKQPPAIEGVRPRGRSEFLPALAALGGKTVQVDPAFAAASIVSALESAGARIERKPDPCQLPKACKNEAELQGARDAHLRDGAALTGFLAWLAGQDSTALDELTVVAKLEAFRARANLYRGPSFETIAGSGPNGAIVHYRATGKTNRVLDANNFLLLDSGAQYPDGTTDVTRTVALGTVTPRQKEMFTRVLKGHIAIATARFPKGTTGQQLDALARQALWEVGANYDHGTGHGVGSYLSVHEGPQRISPVGPISGGGAALAPGMIISNEPGYYEAGAYGIRIENLIVVRTGGDGFLEFETLTLAPIDRAAIDGTLLTAPERAWLNAYHARVKNALLPLLDEQAASWLIDATRPL